MTLKKPNETPGNGGFLFQFKSDDTGEIIQVTGCNSISQLTERAAIQMRRSKTPVPDNLKAIVEHQICLRQSNPMEVCWNGGIGDTLHQKYIKPFLTVIEGKLKDKGRLAKIIGRVVKAVKSCGGCAGRKVYDSAHNSLGRAGTLNTVGNLVFKKLK